jgi:hypothetical protein
MPGLTLWSKIIYQELKLYSWKFNKTLRLHITGKKHLKHYHIEQFLIVKKKFILAERFEQRRDSRRPAAGFLH